MHRPLTNQANKVHQELIKLYLLTSQIPICIACKFSQFMFPIYALLLANNLEGHEWTSYQAMKPIAMSQSLTNQVNKASSRAQLIHSCIHHSHHNFTFAWQNVKFPEFPCDFYLESESIFNFPFKIRPQLVRLPTSLPLGSSKSKLGWGTWLDFGI